MLPGQTSLTIYPISNYSFGTKPPKFEKDTSVAQRMERLKDKYLKEGVRKSVDAVLIVYEHGHPHVLLLQIGSAFFKLPGGRLRPGEGETDCLLRKLNTNLSPEADHLKPEWRIGDVLGTYYRPNYDNIMYPYCPPHIARPKELRRLFLIHLPEKCFLAVPKNYKLIAVPLFEIYDHIQRYGPVISSIPQLLSRFNVVLAAGPGGDAAAAVLQEAKTEEEEEEEVKFGEDGGVLVDVNGPPPPPPLETADTSPTAPAPPTTADDGFTVDFDA